MATRETRKRPNILITGTPGTGKSTLAPKVASNLNMEFIDIAGEIKKFNLYGEYDADYQCHVLDEDKLLDHLQEKMDSDEGGIVVDYHGCEFFPERWFDLVIVLRCDNTILFDRLTERGYPEKKVRENVECEIFGTILDEAKESYSQELVHEFSNENHDQMAENVRKITELALQIKKKK